MWSAPQAGAPATPDKVKNPEADALEGKPSYASQSPWGKATAPSPQNGSAAAGALRSGAPVMEQLTPSLLPAAAGPPPGCQPHQSQQQPLLLPPKVQPLPPLPQHLVSNVGAALGSSFPAGPLPMQTHWQHPRTLRTIEGAGMSVRGDASLAPPPPCSPQQPRQKQQLQEQHAALHWPIPSAQGLLPQAEQPPQHSPSLWQQQQQQQHASPRPSPLHLISPSSIHPFTAHPPTSPPRALPLAYSYSTPQSPQPPATLPHTYQQQNATALTHAHHHISKQEGSAWHGQPHSPEQYPGHASPDVPIRDQGEVPPLHANSSQGLGGDGLGMMGGAPGGGDARCHTRQQGFNVAAAAAQPGAWSLLYPSFQPNAPASGEVT